MNAKFAKTLRLSVLTGAVALGASLAFVSSLHAADGPSLRTEGAPVRSGGSFVTSRQSSEGVLLGPSSAPGGPIGPEPLVTIGTTFEGFGFDDNATENGVGRLFIPPDPLGAAGTDRVIAVVNSMIEARTKAGTLLWRDSLKEFFSGVTGLPRPLGTPTFNPKVVYDHYENRFVVVTLEHVDPSNQSRILLAVSKTATPATATSADWNSLAIDSKTAIGGVDHWADYPGLEVDEEVVYITNNMRRFGASPAFGGVRLWIVHKGVLGGFYAGSPATVTVHDPYAGGGAYTTTMPCEVLGAVRPTVAPIWSRAVSPVSPAEAVQAQEEKPYRSCASTIP